MRIDLTITELDMGGAERCCAELALFLRAQGHCVRVIALGPRPRAPKDLLVQSLSTKGIETEFLNANRVWMVPLIAWKLRRLVKLDNPELIQSFLWHANVVTAFAINGLKIPWIGGVRVAEPRKNRHRIGGWAANRMTKVVCVSNRVAAWCQEHERVDPTKIVVIPNGVTITQTTPEHPSDFQSLVPPASPVLLFVGRLELQKGIDVLIDRADDMLRLLPEHHLVLIGDGSWKERIIERIHRLHARSRIHVLGQRNDVRSWMKRAELLLLPTRYEGMPNVVLEAMAEARSVVTTSVEGNDELLCHELQEQMVEPNDWDSFFRKVVDHAQNKSIRERLAHANYQRVVSNYELEHQLRKYETLYYSVLTSLAKSR